MKLEYIADEDIAVRDYVQKNISRKFKRHLKKIGASYFINDVKANNYDLLKKGDKLLIEFEMESLDDENEYPMDLDIVYETNDLMIINKPSGLKSIPTGFNDFESLYNAIVYYYKQNNINATIHFINRLDKDTSGLLMVCKNKITANIMSKNLDLIDRWYYLMCYNKFKEEIGTINLAILQEGDNMKRIISPLGKESITEYKVLRNGDVSLVQAHLLTGRTHQIRVHFSHINHPLLGDSLYGIKDDYKLRLHSYKIRFTDLDGSVKEFERKPEWL